MIGRPSRQLWSWKCLLSILGSHDLRKELAPYSLILWRHSLNWEGVLLLDDWSLCQVDVKVANSVCFSNASVTRCTYLENEMRKDHPALTRTNRERFCVPGMMSLGIYKITAPNKAAPLGRTLQSAFQFCRQLLVEGGWWLYPSSRDKSNT